RVIAKEPEKSDHRWRLHRAQKILSQMPDLAFAERTQLVNDSVAGFEALVGESPRQHRPRTELSEALGWWGMLLNSAGRPADVEAAYRRAVAIADQLVKDYSTVPYYRTLQASADRQLGILLAMTDRLAEAKPLLTRAAATLEATTEGHVPQWQLWNQASRCY